MINFTLLGTLWAARGACSPILSSPCYPLLRNLDPYLLMFLKAWELPTWETRPAPHRCTAPIRPSTNARGSRVPRAPSRSGHGGGEPVGSWPPAPAHHLPGPGWNVTHIYIYLSFDSVVSWKWQLKRKEYEKGKYILCQIKKKYGHICSVFGGKLRKSKPLFILLSCCFLLLFFT